MCLLTCWGQTLKELVQLLHWLAVTNNKPRKWFWEIPVTTTRQTKISVKLGNSVVIKSVISELLALESKTSFWVCQILLAEFKLNRKTLKDRDFILDTVFFPRVNSHSFCLALSPITRRTLRHISSTPAHKAVILCLQRRAWRVPNTQSGPGDHETAI